MAEAGKSIHTRIGTLPRCNLASPLHAANKIVPARYTTPAFNFNDLSPQASVSRIAVQFRPNGTLHMRYHSNEILKNTACSVKRVVFMRLPNWLIAVR
ncbi:MAG: hypothetical protein JW395_0537 [Nitrospira sp.]|nr:hypothetical protein [Nitrospira sp.]